jgi:hypothetical protein
MGDINIFAVFLAAILALALGGIWYSKYLFLNAWLKASGREIQTMTKHSWRSYGIAFLLALIAALMFSLFLGPRPSFILSLSAGFLTGLCWVGTSFGINYLFANRSFKLFLIDAGYHTLQFTLYGVIFGIWQ